MIILPWRQRVRARWPYMLMYFFFGCAGVVAMFYPSKAVLTTLVSSLAYTWATMLFLGGTLAFTGCVRGGLAGENIGIPLLSGSSAIFAVALFSNGTSAAAIAVGLVFLGIAVGILARWKEVRDLLRTSIHTPKSRRRR